MSLRDAFSAVLQLLRDQQQLSQYDVAGGITQSHISRLEGLKSNATLETSEQLAKALNLHPVAFLALVHAADEQKTARQILEQALNQLEHMELVDASLPSAPVKKTHPHTRSAEAVLLKVQALKAEGKTQTEAMALLGLPRSTLSRYWRKC
ncbi:helix-turn-helix domain-containing protein [Pseudomonas sp.]|uniref:helix-turn-helix domain-containing protein n=1 Tax=Pseudomonas sp. TaxID=306 RepID=UPI003D6FBAC7